MSSDNSNFLARFLAGQSARGRTGPALDVLHRIAGSSAPNPPHRQPTAPQPSPRPMFLDTAATPARPKLAVNPVQTLTACLDTAKLPATARRVFRILFDAGLTSIQKRGLPHMPTLAVFHLPSELLAAHAEVSRETLWRNLKPLKALGLIDERDHYGTLRGQTSVTGKVWAVSLNPSAQLEGRADAVRVRHHDLKTAWRDLDADAQSGRTVYNLTRTDERKQLDAQRAAEREPQQAEARARAKERKTQRTCDQRAGKKPLNGRAAATVNAAETRAARADVPKRDALQQSEKRGLKAVERQEVMNWALTPFLSPSNPDTLTVAVAPAGGLDAIFSLPSLAGLSRKERGAAVEATARSLAATFEDGDNLRFWCWLLWQMLRGSDQGQDWSEDIAHVLARVHQDLRHDETMTNRTARKPAALVAAAFKAAGLLDALRTLTPTRVGVRPIFRAA